MRFQVPQFIEVEDKIFGPLTLKQFIYLIGGAAISFLIYRSLPIFLALIFIGPLIGLSLALAFYKVNNKPFIDIIESAFTYAFSTKLYIWKKKDKKIIKNEEEEDLIPSMYIPKMSDSKLKDLSWSLDIQDKVEKK